MNSTITKAKRYIALDELRGLLLISMMGYHLAWIAGDTFYNSHAALIEGLPLLWQEATASGFIMLSGFCLRFSKNPYKRGLVVFLTGLMITAVTLIATPQLPIIFGIFTFMGSAMLISTPLLDHFEDSPGFSFAYCLGIFLLTHKMYCGYIGVGDFKFAMPHEFYANWITTYLGFPFDDFLSLDYFPIFPHILVFWAGCFLYNLIINSSVMSRLEAPHCKFLQVLGKNSLIVYLVHFPIILALIELVKILN